MANDEDDLRDGPLVESDRQSTGDEDAHRPFSVLFVCTGNVSRSPTAELLFQTALSGEKALRVGSAGTRAAAGSSIDPEMLNRVEKDIRFNYFFESKQVSRELVSAADLVLGMTREHRAAAVRLSPPVVRSAFTLEEFAWLIEMGPSLEESTSPTTRLRAAVHSAESRRVSFRLGADRDDDIADPIGQSRTVYDRTFDRIFRAVGTITEFATGRAPR